MFEDIRIFLILVFIGIMVIATPFYVYLTGDSETVTVEDKERVCNKDNDCRYLIWTNKGVFENTDSVLHLKFNSSDVYGEIEVGEEYEINYYGWRVPILSMYPNIFEKEEL